MLDIGSDFYLTSFEVLVFHNSHGPFALTLHNLRFTWFSITEHWSIIRWYSTSVSLFGLFIMTRISEWKNDLELKLCGNIKKLVSELENSWKYSSRRWLTEYGRRCGGNSRGLWHFRIIIYKQNLWNHCLCRLQSHFKENELQNQRVVQRCHIGKVFFDLQACSFKKIFPLNHEFLRSRRNIYVCLCMYM